MAAAAFGGRVILTALQMPTDAGGRAVACRDCCGHWQVFLILFVMVIPKIDFSLFVVFLSFVFYKDYLC
ncbi:hypothetical protein HBI56_240240 [Parastagonospora nodorum]|nr:hypothetical protein HBH51_249760 [Parastagonospora nodorum]KAH3958771.1 hypothetical protein HBH52_248540 [Parastagonospora nodorum]KAH4009416.1 hypothetical protein HBI09_235680 [Parastagonospora nodorum]KAH4042442.1 hypothetical protein HBH49_251850 [Parastagonospora nodorum]KAH4111617.1 hypothetical protein HBH47_241120 [Parastagonospora nodorum]